MAAVAKPSEVGPVYDLLLATRDGEALPCRNRDGQIVMVSQVAYNGPIDRNQIQKEETELQHKDNLVQLGSSAIIDREMTNWPQVTQGDWTGGTLQRVYSGPNGDPTRYWDGRGLLWPLFDYVPQQPFVGTHPDIGFNQLIDGSAYGCVGGWVALAGINAQPGYAIIYRENTPKTWVDWYYGTDFATMSDPFGAGIGADAFCVGGGAIYAAARPDATHIRIYRINGSGANTLQVDASLDTGLSNNTDLFAASIDAKQVGNKFYVALGVTYFHPVNGVSSSLVIQDWTVPAGPAAQTSISLPSGHAAQVGMQVVTDVKIVGDSVYVVMSEGSTSNKGWDSGQLMAGAGSRAVIIAFSIPGNSFSTVAMIESASGAHIGAIGSTLFVLAYTSQGADTALSVDMYLLQGATLQHIGPVFFPTPNWNSASKVAAWGPYAFFGLQRADLSVSTYECFAYDVLRGRMFHVFSRDIPGFHIGAPIGHDIATFGSSKEPFVENYVPGVFVQFGVAIDVSDFEGGTFGKPLTDERWFGITPLTDFGGVELIPPPLQQPVDITSGIIDFTSAQPKLYRQVLATFLTLAASPLASARLRAWLDQDPETLSATPDFETFISGDTSPGATQLALRVNQIATKLVYELVTTGGTFDTSGIARAAPKPVSVIVKAATGWVQTLTLDLAPQVQSNSKNVSDIWTYQGIDHVVAYNFLRMLWRLKGGQLTATLPNGDSGPWQMEDGEFNSPKPFGVSFRADQASGLKFITIIKIREDID